jgi:hypothetical protein
MSKLIMGNLVTLDGLFEGEKNWALNQSAEIPIPWKVQNSSNWFPMTPVAKCETASKHEATQTREYYQSRIARSIATSRRSFNGTDPNARAAVPPHNRAYCTSVTFPFTKVTFRSL